MDISDGQLSGRPGSQLTQIQRALEGRGSVLHDQTALGFAKVCYCGLAKNLQLPFKVAS